MSKVRVLTPVVAVKDNMENATALKVDRLEANKVRIGLLDNTKPNTGRLLGYVGQMLMERGLAASTFDIDKKDSPANHSSSSATAAVFKQLSEKADFVITGLGN
jgi:hypothetical protein